MKNSTLHARKESNFNELKVTTRFLQLLAVLTGVLYLRFFLTHTFSAEIVADQRVISVMAFILLIGAVIGLLATWRWEKVGGLVTLLCGLCLAFVTWRIPAENHWLTTFFYSSPFIIAGGLSLISWQSSQNNK